jgi:predicted aldo/keto reductase-like oxidoreductase
VLALARSRRMGVIAMKTIRYGHSASLRPTELLRYSLSLEGVNTVIVGLDSPRHLAENAAVASNFRPIKQAGRDELSRRAKRTLAGVLPPWDRPGYVDGRALG